jgi:DNA repair protein RAD51
MAEEYEDGQMGDESGMTGPGAPTPISALEVRMKGRQRKLQ